MNSIKNVQAEKDMEITVFPPEQLPSCWHNKTRINALFAPFRQKTVNPEDWESKLKFWSNLIKKWCEIKGCANFTMLELKKVFVENKRSPACLETVIQEMLKSAEIRSATSFYEPPQVTWSGWAVNTFVKKPLQWSFDTIKSTMLSPPIEEDTIYIVLEMAKVKNGNDLLKKLKSFKSGVFDKGLLSLQTVQECSKELNLSEEGTIIALHQLYLQNKIAIKTIQDKINSNSKHDTIIKLPDANNSCAALTQVDISIYTLQQNEKYLMDSINDLEERKELLRLEAKKYLETNKHNMAKNCLKRKRQFDTAIAKRVQTLDNIQGLLVRIQESQQDSKVLDGYQSGLAALKETMKEFKLNSDFVQDTMANLQDTLEECDDIQSELSNLKIDNTDIGELEDELEQILNKTDNEETKHTEKLKTPVLYPELPQNHDSMLTDMLSKLPKIPEKLSPKRQEIEHKIME